MWFFRYSFNFLSSLFKSVFVPRSAKSLIEEAQEQLKSNAPLVELHAKLVTVLWIIMGLEMKSVKPLSLFDTVVNMTINKRIFYPVQQNTQQALFTREAGGGDGECVCVGGGGGG